MYYQRSRNIGIIEIIISINAAFFIIPRLLSYIMNSTAFLNSFYGLFALNININYPFTINNGAFWQILTSIFMHGGMMHIFFNMFALYIFGKPLEERWGKMKFLSFYLTTGILANIASILFFILTVKNVSMVGASGAVFGVLLAFGGYYPEVTLLLFFVIPLKAKWAILLMAVLSLFFQITNTMGSIGHITHLFGFLFGFLYLLIFFKTNAIKEMFFRNRNYYY
jgi:membrane associated rhomboid family serine protease